MKDYLFRTVLCLLTCVLVGRLAAARTIEFETTEVTTADVAVAPDGQELIFTLLGHLFRLPVEGGTADQLTFGPYYDTDPVFSPDGSRVADPKFRTFAHLSSFRKGQTGLCVKYLNYNGKLGGWIGQLASIRAAHRLGIKLQVGTDATQACVFYGLSLHWELEYFVQAGIPPLEVLRMATQEAAAGVGADDDLGTLTPGKLADIVLLNANPLEDIKNTQSIWRVIKGGWVFDPEKLRPPVSTSATK